MTPLDAALDVLGVMVGAAEDQQILHPAHHEQIPLVEEAEIAGVEAPGEGLLVTPVALGDRSAAHADLADLPIRERSSLWTDDVDEQIRQRGAAADLLRAPFWHNHRASRP